jgi:hypothetical protein
LKGLKLLMRLSCPLDSVGILLFTLPLGAALCLGCGNFSGNVSHLSGEIKLDGQALPEGSLGSITFRPADDTQGKPITSEILGSRYDCPAVPNGNVSAMVSISIPTGKTYMSDRTGQQVTETKVISLVPEQAQGIQIEVAGDSSYDLDLQTRTKK